MAAAAEPSGTSTSAGSLAASPRRNGRRSGAERHDKELRFQIPQRLVAMATAAEPSGTHKLGLKGKFPSSQWPPQRSRAAPFVNRLTSEEYQSRNGRRSGAERHAGATARNRTASGRNGRRSGAERHRADLARRRNSLRWHRKAIGCFGSRSRRHRLFLAPLRGPSKRVREPAFCPAPTFVSRACQRARVAGPNGSSRAHSGDCRSGPEGYPNGGSVNRGPIVWPLGRGPSDPHRHPPIAPRSPGSYEMGPKALVVFN